jgi:hypothetical protein
VNRQWKNIANCSSSRTARIEKSALYLDHTSGFGVDFYAKTVEKYGKKIV